jgi:type II secretion system protein H
MQLRGDNRGGGGFTLVELMVVLVIIGVTAGVMVAEMRGTFEDALLRGNARKIIDVCDVASNRAIAVHQAQVLRIDPKSGRYVVRAKSITRGDDEDSGSAPELPTVVGELDSRVTLEIREPQRELQEEEAAETERAVEMDAITFFPDGSAEAREFLFRDREGMEIVLRLNPSTSRVRILDMNPQ